MTNTMQIKVVEMKYILLWYIIEEKYSEKRVEKMKERGKKNERKKISFFFSGYILQEIGSPFINFPNDFH